MQNRLFNERYVVSFPVRIKWKDQNNEEMTEEGQTEHISYERVLVHLMRKLPEVGSDVELTVINDLNEIVKAKAKVLRLERNASYPQCTLLLTEVTKEWERRIWQRAAELAYLTEKESEEEW
jgi:hypothetical protein